jgi:hypothetical protein
LDKPLPVSEVPFSDVAFPADLIHANRAVVSGLAFAILKCAADLQSAVDKDVLTALQALAETYRTLGSGLYYEKPPAGGPPQAIYKALAQYLDDLKKKLAEQGASGGLKDSNIFFFLVFLLRVGRQQTNGRPRARMFLEFLRGQFPQAEMKVEEGSRIIVP